MRCEGSNTNMREWRNWQTRTFEGRVDLPYGFKSRFSHHKGISVLRLMPLFCLKELSPHSGFIIRSHAFMEEQRDGIGAQRPIPRSGKRFNAFSIPRYISRTFFRETESSLRGHSRAKRRISRRFVVRILLFPKQQAAQLPPVGHIPKIYRY